MNTSRFLIGSALLVAASLAHSGAVTLTLADHGHVRAYHPYTQFQINPELGRAWISVSFQLDPAWDESPMHFERVAVEGLRFDTGQSAIVMAFGDRDIICANVSERRFLGWTGHRIAPTGMCRLETVTQRKPVDNGFFISNRDVSRTLMHVEG
ncbi:hypothetical protein [Isoalcanivorax indicus]|uniref:hypothetical protein n=1 Tax=Isoalcanivorax indicus TaxID=2202653 RepID=UPI0013C4A823|nr:hypothetical protein [Isoalcanivorax indicus]